MTRIRVLIFIIFTACGQVQTHEYPPLTQRFIDSPDRTCEAITATRYETVDDLLKDFYESAKYKDSLELNLRLGTHFFYKKELDSALYYYDKVKAIDSTDADLYFNFALVYSDKGEFGKGIRSVDKAMSICGERWDLLNSKCYMLGELNRCPEAIVAGITSRNLNPENLKIYGNLVRCFDKLEMADSVVKYVNLVESKFGSTSEWMKAARDKYR